MDYLAFLDLYHERVRAFHVKDAEFRPSGRSGVYGGYQDWIDRPGRFRSLGDGQIDFRQVFSKMAQYDYPGWAVVEWECCIKHPEAGAAEGAVFVRDHIIRVTDRAFDDFAGGGADARTQSEDSWEFSAFGAAAEISQSKFAARRSAKAFSRARRCHISHRGTVATRREEGGQLLPRESLQTDAHLGASDRGHDLEPFFAQVGTALVVENAKAAIGGVGRQHVADELIARVAGLAGRAESSCRWRMNECRESPMTLSNSCDAFSANSLACIHGRWQFQREAANRDQRRHRSRDRPQQSPRRASGSRLQSVWLRPAESRTAYPLRCGRIGHWLAEREPSSRKLGLRLLRRRAHCKSRQILQRPGVQKMFISSASELMHESSSRQRRTGSSCGFGRERAA